MRRWGFRIAALAIVAALAFGGWWWWAADALQKGVERWAEGQRAQGYAVSWTGISKGGFPASIDLILRDPVIEAPELDGARAWRWAGPALTLIAVPWRPEELAFAAPGGHQLSVRREQESHTYNIAAGTLSGRFVGGPQGSVTVAATDLAGTRQGDDATLKLQSLAVQAFGPEGSAQALAVGTAGASSPSRTVAARATLTALGLSLPKTAYAPIGHDISRLFADLRLRGPIPVAATATAALDQWRDGGGALDIAAIEVVWPTLTLSGDGSMALDPNRQPEGAATVRLEGYRGALNTLAREGVIRAGDALAANFALSVLSRAQGETSDSVRAPLTVQDRWLSLGPARLFRLPPIRWE